MRQQLAITKPIYQHNGIFFCIFIILVMAISNEYVIFYYRNNPKKYLPVYRCYQDAFEMLCLLFEDEENRYDISHSFRKKYQYLMDTLLKTSEAIVGLDTNAPQPCNELATLQWCLMQLCWKLHSAFV